MSALRSPRCLVDDLLAFDRDARKPWVKSRIFVFSEKRRYQSRSPQYLSVAVFVRPSASSRHFPYPEKLLRLGHREFLADLLFLGNDRIPVPDWHARSGRSALLSHLDASSSSGHPWPRWVSRYGSDALLAHLVWRLLSLRSGAVPRLRSGRSQSHSLRGGQTKGAMWIETNICGRLTQGV